MDTETRVRRVLQETMPDNTSLASLSRDTSLQSVGLDSCLFIHAVVGLEEEFSIEFPPEKLVVAEADTLEALCAIVESQTESTPAIPCAITGPAGQP